MHAQPNACRAGHLYGHMLVWLYASMAIYMHGQMPVGPGNWRVDRNGPPEWFERVGDGGFHTEPESEMSDRTGEGGL